MQHRLVIIGSLDENVQLVKMAKERGYYTIVCDGYPNGLAKKVADKEYTIDVRNVNAIAEMCVAEKADGIIGSFSDLIFEQITKIAAQAGIKWYATPDKLKYYREKNETKDLLASLGAHVPKHTVLRSDFSTEDIGTLKYPLVIKPVNGWGSKGIFVVHSEKEIRDKFDECIGQGATDLLEVEEFSEGREYNMMTWLIDGNIHVISIADREKNPQIGESIPMLNRVVYPAKNIHNIIDEATEVLRKFARATGQMEGALSMQFFYNQNGVEVCEIAGRLFGYEHEMVTFCSGFSIEDMLLNYVYEPEKLQEMLERHTPFFDKVCAGLYFLGKQGKTIADMSMIYKLSEDPHVVDTLLFYKEGDKIDNFGPASYLVRYYLFGQTRAEVDELTEQFFEKMTVKDENNEEVSYHFIMEQ